MKYYWTSKTICLTSRVLKLEDKDLGFLRKKENKNKQKNHFLTKHQQISTVFLLLIKRNSQHISKGS